MAGGSVIRTYLASFWALCLFSNHVITSPVSRQALTTDEIAKRALDNAYKVLGGTLSDGSTHTTCTKENVGLRKEYGDMTTTERAAYISAVQCILQRPSKLSPTQYPGAVSRFDDFVVVHMNMTPGVHNTANFMHWHRYYIWAYETALRTECNYKGYQPYWNWGKYSDLPNSPIFNGDEYSMGGNGDYIPHKGTMIGRFNVPAGPGGGCVTTGPFKNMTVHLGPLSPTLDPAINIPKNPRADGYGNNPRCLRRDVNNYFVTQFLRPIDLSTHITSHSTIGAFQDTLQADTATAANIHGSGHFSIWGDPGGDVYVSPSEPTFWLHHGQLDRHWWMWQNYIEAEVKNRTQQYEGGTNWLNPTTSPRGKITDPQWLSIVAPTGYEGVPSKDLVSTTAGPFCYIYV